MLQRLAGQCRARHGRHTPGFPSEQGTLNLTPVAAGLDHPWALAFLPDRQGILVTERPGNLRLVGADGKLSAPLSGVPKVWAKGQGGLLDVALSPDFKQDRMVYLSYAEGGGAGGTAGTAVGRGRLSDDLSGLKDFQVIFRQEPKLSTGNHFGSRLVFDRDGYLFVTLGENNDRPTAQDLDKLQGKIVRLYPDGRVPDDNPFVGQAGVRPEIWSYGHRNPQGAGAQPLERHPLGERTRAQGWRRDQYHRARQELRLASGDPRHQLFRPADPRGRGPDRARHRGAAPCVGEVPRHQRHGLL